MRSSSPAFWRVVRLHSITRPTSKASTSGVPSGVTEPSERIRSIVMVRVQVPSRRDISSAPPEPVKLEPPKGESRKTRALYKLAASMGENGLDAAVDFKPLLDKYLSDDENSVDDMLPRRSDFTWILIRF